VGRPLKFPQLRLSPAHPGSDHEGVVGVFGDLPPQVFVVAERDDRIPDLFVVGIAARGFRVHLFGRLQTGLHNRRREWSKLGTIRNQSLEGLRILRIVIGLLPYIAGSRRRFEDGLVAFRQFVPLGEVYEHVVSGAALPPAWIIVVLDDFVEAELLVVIGADPFCGVDGALLQCRIDVATGDLLRDDT